ncbi:F-box incomplete domain containing protein [Pandoravirus japonicus]|uniref:F-box incomplete domain containing protein n=1 Tax=Pandoravirus japonicus TaxID=2823154 RepID=A0A811BN44_9VIRU|nr:F-box incomplete domain containing protein [Pandoravirus japonicus]
MDDLGQGADEDLINRLPGEILAHILASLPEGSVEVAARTCHRWRAAAIALVDVGGTRGTLTGRMGMRRETINHAAGGGHRTLIVWLREVEQSPWSEDTAVAALRAGHFDIFESILGAGGVDVLGPRLAAASVAYGGTHLLERLEQMRCPVDGWTLMVGAAVLPSDAIRTLLRWQYTAAAHFVAALLGRTDVLGALCNHFGTVKFTPAFQAVLDPAVIAHMRDYQGIRVTMSNQDSDRLCEALADRGAGLSGYSLVDLLLDLQREGHVATHMHQWLADRANIPVASRAQGVRGPCDIWRSRGA